jgi:hypothetical protein
MILFTNFILFSKFNNKIIDAAFVSPKKTRIDATRSIMLQLIRLEWIKIEKSIYA